MFTIICHNEKLVNFYLSTIDCEKKVVHVYANFESMDPCSQHFSLNTQGALINYF